MEYYYLEDEMVHFETIWIEYGMIIGSETSQTLKD